MNSIGKNVIGLEREFVVEALAKVMKLDIDLRLDPQKTFLVTISGLRPAAAS